MIFLPLDICPGRVPLRGGGRHIPAEPADRCQQILALSARPIQLLTDAHRLGLRPLRAGSLGLCARNGPAGSLLSLGSRQDRCLGADQRVVTILLGLLQLGATGRGVAPKLLKLALCLLLRSFGGRPRLIEIGGHLIELNGQLHARPLPFR